MKRVYLDNAAATPVDKRVLKSMLSYFTDEFYNPSALYEGARHARKAIETARESVAKSIGCRPSEVIFTAGGTESDNLAINGVMRANPDANLVISSIEHDAVYEPSRKHKMVQSPVGEDGKVDLTKLKSLVNDETILVSIIYVNNEIGTVQSIGEVVEIISEIRKERKARGVNLPIYIHTDACQAPLYLDVNVGRLGVDMMTLNGGKICGPKQSGILYIKAGVILHPEVSGGGQEFGYRSGTENVAFAVGFAKALELASKSRTHRVKNVSSLRDYMIERLENEFGGTINGAKKNRVANNVNVTFEGVDNERVLFSLDEMGVDAAAGSACSASKDVSSRVLLAIGKTDEQARASLRFSLGIDTTKEDIDFVLNLLKTALKA